MNTSNPYQSPCDEGRGVYDWSLAMRAFCAFALLAIFYLLCGAVSSWQTFRADCSHRHEPVINTVVEFALDWKDGHGLE